MKDERAANSVYRRIYVEETEEEEDGDDLDIPDELKVDRAAKDTAEELRHFFSPKGKDVEEEVIDVDALTESTGRMADSFEALGEALSEDAPPVPKKRPKLQDLKGLDIYRLGSGK